MSPGTIVGIFIAPRAGESQVPVSEVRVLAGKGLEGDRYFKLSGTFSDRPGPGREVTLIEAEALEALARDYGISIEPPAARRNLVTRGVALNHLVGREFRVGEVRLRGVRLCEPCSHLERLTAKGIQRGLVHRGGLRADVIRGGVIRMGAEVA